MKSGKIQVNHKTIKDRKYPVRIMDPVESNPKVYRCVIRNQRLTLNLTHFILVASQIDKFYWIHLLKYPIHLHNGQTFGSENQPESNFVNDNIKTKLYEYSKISENDRVYRIKGKHLGEVFEFKRVPDKWVWLQNNINLDRNHRIKYEP